MEFGKIIQSKNRDHGEPLTDPKCIRTFVVAVHASGEGVSRFRTYTQEHGKATNCTIVEAARAMSAAPTIFAPITIKPPSTGQETQYINRGVGLNKPAEQALLELEQI